MPRTGCDKNNCEMDTVIVKLEKLFQWFFKVHIDPTVTIRTVSCALLEVSSQWQEVGKSLNVPKEVLQQIEDECKEDVSKCLYQVIYYWITSNNKCAWSKIKKVLKDLKKEECILKLDSHEEGQVEKLKSSPEDQIFEKDLQRVCIIILQHAPTKWKFIGAQLGIPNFRLACIESDCHKLEDRIYEMIYSWPLDRESTWHDIIVALQNIQCDSAAEAMKELAAKQLNSVKEYCERNSKEVGITPEMKEREAVRDSRIAFYTDKKDDTKHRNEATLQDIRTLLQVEDKVCEENIKSNMSDYIKNAKHLTKDNAKKLKNLIERLAQNKQEYSKELRLEAKNLHKDLVQISEIEMKLHQNKQKLESAQTDLNREKEKIRQKIEPLTQQKSHYRKYKIINEVLHEEDEVQKKLKHVLKEIQKIENDLELVNTNKKAISDTLNHCRSELAACVKDCSEFEKTLEESLKDIPLMESFATVGAVLGGTVVGGATGMASGSVVGPPGAALIGAAGVVIGACTGHYVGGKITHKYTPDKDLTMRCKEMFDSFAKELQEAKKQLKEVQDLALTQHYKCPS